MLTKPKRKWTDYQNRSNSISVWVFDVLLVELSKQLFEIKLVCLDLCIELGRLLLNECPAIDELLRGKHGSGVSLSDDGDDACRLQRGLFLTSLLTWHSLLKVVSQRRLTILLTFSSSCWMWKLYYKIGASSNSLILMFGTGSSCLSGLYPVHLASSNILLILSFV